MTCDVAFECVQSAKETARRCCTTGVSSLALCLIDATHNDSFQIDNTSIDDVSKRLNPPIAFFDL